MNDAATGVIFLIGSKLTKKSLFVKRTFLPFLVNEMFANIDEKKGNVYGVYQIQCRLSAFEIQDEVVSDLLRPTSRGLSVGITAEDGVLVSGLHKEVAIDELGLRRFLEDACENRVNHT